MHQSKPWRLLFLPSLNSTMKMKLPRKILTAISALAFLTTITPLTRAVEPTDPTKNYLGLNTWFAYSGRPFADLMHGGGIQLLTDSSGPMTDFVYVWGTGTNAGTQLSANGTYNLQFTGQATITCPYSAPVTISGQTYNSSTNITTATVTVAYPDDSQVPKQVWLQFTNTQRTPTGSHNGLTGLSLTYPASVTVDNHTLANGYLNSHYPTYYPVTDTDGWPLADFTASYITDTVGTMTGTYSLSFTGTTTSVTSQYGGFSVGAISYNSTTNTSTANVVVPTGSSATTISLKFLGTKRDSTGTPGLTNIRLLRPGYDGTEMFSSEYKTIMSKADVVRFMDWGLTNFNPSVSWSDRAHPNGIWNGPVTGVDANGLPVHGTKGAAYEAMVQLCNELNTDMYVDVPARADDTYVTNLANLIKYGSDGINPYTSTQTNPVWPPLNSNLKVYVEYSNEMWNTICEPYYDAFNTAQFQLNSPTQYPIEYDGTTDVNVLKIRYVAYRASQISLLFRSVFGDSAMPGTSANPRVRPLFESQTGNPGGQLSPGLKFLDTFYGATNAFNTTVHPVSYFFYGGGGAAYYSITGVSGSTSPDPSVVFAPGTGHYVGSTWGPAMYLDTLWVGNFGMKRTAYEGGMGLPTISGSWTTAAEWTINTDSRMVEVEQEFHDTWTQSGGDLLNYYTHGATSQWGFTPAFDNTTASKLLGLDGIHASTRKPVVTQATVIQGSPTSSVTGTVPIASLDSSHIIENGYFYYTTSPERTLDGFGSGEYIAFGVDAPVAGNYTSVLRYRIYNTVAATVHIYVNGVLVPNPTGATTPTPDVVLPGTSNAMANFPITVPLPAGLSVVRIACTANGLAIASDSFTLPDVTNGLMARWNFDSDATDTSSSGSVADNGTLVGSPSYVTGANAVVGTGAISLNGTSQYMTVANSADVNLTTACSFTAWVKIASTTDNSYRMIISKKAAYTDNGGYELFYHPVLKQLLLRCGGNATSYSMSLPLTLDTNWHHLAVTVNGSSATFYVDGVPQTGATGTVGNPPSSTQGLVIGRRSGTTDYPWNGQLDDVRLYNRALSAAEVTDILAQEQ